MKTFLMLLTLLSLVGLTTKAYATVVVGSPEDYNAGRAVNNAFGQLGDAIDEGINRRRERKFLEKLKKEKGIEYPGLSDHEAVLLYYREMMQKKQGR